MKEYSFKGWMLPVLIMIMIMAAFLLTTPVSADDGTPVDVSPTLVATEPTPTPEPTLIAPEPTVEPTVIAPEPTSVPEPTVPAPSAPALSGRSTTFSEVTGSSASIENPYYTVGTTTYHFAVSCFGLPAPCSEGADPITRALASMATNGVPTDRKLYIGNESGLDNVFSDVVEIDGITHPELNGLLGIVGQGDVPENVTIQGGITVSHKSGGFSLSNLKVTDNDAENAAVWFQFVNGPISLVDVVASNGAVDSSGIFIDSLGSVTLNRVESHNNGYHGIRIENPMAAVSINNSSFNHNLLNVDDGYCGYDGSWDEFGDCVPGDEQADNTSIYISNTTAPITLNGVSSQDNNGTGAYIYGPTSIITIKNSLFHNNSGPLESGTGLLIYGNTVTLENIRANHNQWEGILANVNNSFTSKGLWLENNGGQGLYVDACADSGDSDPFCDNSGLGTVTVTTAASSNNQSDGFYIRAKGVVTINDTFAGWNQDDGYEVINLDSPVPSAVNIKLATGLGNGKNGLVVLSKGVITLFNFKMNDNNDGGLYIEHLAPTAIVITNEASRWNETIHNGYFYNNVSGEWENTGGFGYYITTYGPVTITNMDAIENDGDGGFIDNSLAATPAPVTVTILLSPSISGMNGYQNNHGTGLLIISRGAVLVNSIQAEGNTETGTIIVNLPPAPTLPGVPVTIINSSFSRNNDNQSDEDIHSSDGLQITTKGLVTILNLTANENDGYGAFIVNIFPGTTSGVTINAGPGLSNDFSRNASSGITIYTNGAVLITNMDAHENGGTGVTIDNTFGTASVTLKDTRQSAGGDYSNNGGKGLDINSVGSVSLVIARVNNNTGSGISINTMSGSGSVTIIGKNAQVNGNGYDGDTYGISIGARGNIVLTGIEVMDNQVTGGYLVNAGGSGGITLTNMYFDWNGIGLTAISSGAVVWKNGTVNCNTSYGAQIINSTTQTPKPVTLTGVTASGNGGTGIFIDSKGAVTVANGRYNNNSMNNGSIRFDERWSENMSEEQTWNFTSTSGEDVTIQVSSEMFNPGIEVYDSYGNYLDGDWGVDGDLSLIVSLPEAGDYQIRILTDQWNGQFPYSVSINETATPPTNFDEFTDSSDGLMIINMYGFDLPVNVTNVNREWSGNNSGSNVEIVSSGAVTVTNMDLNDSSSSALIITNRDSSKADPVTITGVNAYNNKGNGFNLVTDGVVKITNVDLGNHGGYGIFIESMNLTAPITMTNVSVRGTGQNGLTILSKGPVSLTNVLSQWSAASGIFIQSQGAVSFTNVDAIENTLSGAHIDTTGTFTTFQPADRSSNGFAWNGGTGLEILTSNKITLTRVNAFDNGYRENDGTELTNAYGIYINNMNATGLVPVILTQVTTNNNTADGINIATTSAVTLSKIYANNNYSSGISIVVSDVPVIFPAVTLTDIEASGNGGNGVYILGRGNIVATRMTTNSNNSTGAYLNNLSGKGTVTVTGSSSPAYYASWNGARGMDITSSGAIQVTGMEFNGNNLDGLLANNAPAAIPSNLTVTNVIVDGNKDNGLNLLSNGTITVNNAFVTNNYRDGINTIGSGNTFINNSAFISNGWSGIYAFMDPSDTLKLTNCTWFGNMRNFPEEPLPGDHKNLTYTGLLTIL